MSLFNPADLMLPDPESCASRFVVSPWMLMSPEPERTKSDSVAMSSLILNLPEPDKTNLLVNAFNLSTKMLPDPLGVTAPSANSDKGSV